MSDPTENGLEPEAPPRRRSARQTQADLSSTIELARENMLRLLAAFPHPPTALRVEAGAVTIEAEWLAAGPPVEATAPVAASKAVQEAPAAQPAQIEAGSQNGAAGGDRDARHYLRAPTVGVFYRAPEPGAKPFVEVGDTVVAGQQVAIIEVMKLMIPLESDVDGTVTEILPANGQAVEYDEPLIAIAPSR